MAKTPYPDSGMRPAAIPSSALQDMTRMKPPIHSMSATASPAPNRRLIKRFSKGGRGAERKSGR